MKEVGVEIERKWLLDKLPDETEQFPHREIVQGYLCTDPVIRVRQDGDDYYLTYKGRGKISREEYNLPLNASAFEKLCCKCDGTLIEKTRYRIPIDAKGNILSEASQKGLAAASCDDIAAAGVNLYAQLTAEVDVFKGKYAGLIYAEVEFTNEASAEAFTKPDWFGEEVTYKSGYSNAELASGLAADDIGPSIL